MLFKNHKKITALALCGALSLGILGSSMSVTEASSHHPAPRYEREYHPHMEKNQRHVSHHESKSKNKYSEGDRNTAAIVGAVVGYAIGKLT